MQIAYAVEFGAPSDPTSASFGIHIVDTGTGESRLLARNVWYPRDLRWSPDGRQIAFCTPGAGGKLWVVRGDATEAKEFANRCGSAVWSPDGSKIAFAAPFDMAQSDIFAINRDGTGSVNLTNSVDEFNVEPSWSSDGQQLVFRRGAPNGDASQAGDLYLVGADGSDLIQLTNDGLTESGPQWSPRDDVILYAAAPKGALMGPETRVYLIDLDRKEPRNLRDRSMLPRWSPDGSHIAYMRLTDEETPKAELRVMDAAGETDVRIAGPLAGSSPEWYLYDWSPDGKKLAFVLDQVGGMDLFVANVDGTGLTRITNDLSTRRGLAWGPVGAPKSLAAQPLDLAPPGLTGTPTATPTATPTPTPTAPAVDARSVPVESLLRPGAKLEKVLYASFDDALPEEIVVYSSVRYVPDNPDCAAQPYLDVFAYDQQGQGWAKVFDGVEGPDAVIPDLRSQYETGVVCAIGDWIDPLELMDFDGDGKQELLVRVGGGGGSGNPGDVRVLGFEGAGLELRARKLLQAWLWKAQDVVVASQGELWLEQVITSKWEPVGHAAAVLRGVVRYDKNQQTITIVDQEARLLCTEGTVTAKAQDLLTLSCESNEVPGLMDPYPAQLDFSVDPLTRFDPKPAVNSLEDVQIGDHVRIGAATLGLSAGGLAPEWVFVDGAWAVPGASYASPVAGLVEVVSAP
jgi:Tol biopolymer transport system component